MDAKEIRAYLLCGEGMAPRLEVSALCDIARMLRELTAQIAELNYEVMQLRGAIQAK
jgi:hypothetical protein